MFFLDWHTLECLENQVPVSDLMGDGRGMSPEHLSLCQGFIPFPFTIQVQQQKITFNFSHISELELPFLFFCIPISDQRCLGKSNLWKLKQSPLNFQTTEFFPRSLNKASTNTSSFFYWYSLVLSRSCNTHSSPHHLSYCSDLTSVTISTLCCGFPARLRVLQLFQATVIRFAESISCHHLECSGFYWQFYLFIFNK